MTTTAARTEGRPMFGIRYFKAPPTTYVLLYRGGRVARGGPGLSFLYYAPHATVVAVPLASVDVPFVVQAVTADFQPVTVQGQLTYRVTDPVRLSSMLDYSVRPDGKYQSDDPRAPAERLVHAAEVATGEFVGGLPLREAIVAARPLAEAMFARLKEGETVTSLGLELLDLFVLAVRPTPETARALEADARERMQREADEALYARRNAAVLQERQVKESELTTEIAVEEKKRQIRETKMAADIAAEEQRSSLIERQVDNDRRAADAIAYALEARLKPLRATDWKTLVATAAGNDPGAHIALAFRELAENAGRVGTLNITPDLLQSLVEPEGQRRVRQNRSG